MTLRPRTTRGKPLEALETSRWPKANCRLTPPSRLNRRGRPSLGARNLPPRPPPDDARLKPDPPTPGSSRMTYRVMSSRKTPRCSKSAFTLCAPPWPSGSPRHLMEAALSCLGPNRSFPAPTGDDSSLQQHCQLEYQGVRYPVPDGRGQRIKPFTRRISLALVQPPKRARARGRAAVRRQMQ